MARRGDLLREHILWIAKDVFLEMGFERTSMDVVASRAETSKRSLYAYFESKEKLFLAVIELVRCLFLSRLKMPGDYGGEPADALVLFCARYLETLLYEPSIQMIRISMAESERFPEQASEYFEVMFTEVERRVSTYLETACAVPPELSLETAHRLLGRILYPRFMRALLGIDTLATTLEDEEAALNADLTSIRKAVTESMEALPPKQVGA